MSASTLDNHGSTPQAWTTVTFVAVGAALGAVGVALGSWAFFGVGVGCIVVGPIVGLVMSALSRSGAPRTAQSGGGQSGGGQASGELPKGGPVTSAAAENAES